jgi:hypothetical protein
MIAGVKVRKRTWIELADLLKIMCLSEEAKQAILTFCGRLKIHDSNMFA